MLRLATVAAMLALIACSGEGSDDDGGGDGGQGDGDPSAQAEARAACGMDCDRLAAAMCSMAPSREVCVNNCGTSYLKCPTETAALFRCMPTYECDPDGRPGFRDCQPELSAAQACW